MVLKTKQQSAIETKTKSATAPEPEQIASLAYALWQQRGCPEGSPEARLASSGRGTGHVTLSGPCPTFPKMPCKVWRWRTLLEHCCDAETAYAQALSNSGGLVGLEFDQALQRAEEA